MHKRIIAVGPLFNSNTKATSGQSMMFQLFIDELANKGIKFMVINIDGVFSSGTKRRTGTFSIKRLLDYFLIFVKALVIFPQNINQILYLTTAQSKVGFIRDYIFINMAVIFNCRIITHQFGANYSGFYNNQSPFLKKIIKVTFNKTHKIIVEGEFTKKQLLFLNDFEKKVPLFRMGYLKNI